MKLMMLFRSVFLSLMLLMPFTAVGAEMVNINTASSSELAAAMSGIGSSKAEAIVAYREANGPFKTIDDLVRVKGIGDATVSKNLDRITVGASE